MEVRDSGENLVQDSRGLVLREANGAVVGIPLGDLVEELAALAELGDDVDVLEVFEGLDESDDAERRML